MGYRVGSIRRAILIVNIAMCICTAVSVHLFMTQDYLAAWVIALMAAIIMVGVPANAHRLIENTTKLIRAYNNNDDTVKVKIPGYADELQDLNEELQSLKEKTRQTRATNAISAVLMNSVIDHLPFALLVYDQEGRIYYTNQKCVSILGAELTFLTALPQILFELYQCIDKLPSPGQTVFTGPGLPELSELLISKNRFQQNEVDYYLVTLKSIKTEMDKRELLSWQKLIRVLNHEIINSLTPISSLADSMGKMIDTQGPALDKPLFKNSLDLIAKRSEHLMQFVQKYRQLAVIGVPDLQPTDLRTLLSDTLDLFETDLKELGITVNLRLCQRPLPVFADQPMLQQVFINVIKNAMQALQAAFKPQIGITAQWQAGMAQVIIADNGCGITPKAIDYIFIPFFTTKKQSSGIGLALCKQIVQLHKGEIELKSDQETGTKVFITLPGQGVVA